LLKKSGHTTTVKLRRLSANDLEFVRAAKVAFPAGIATR